MSQSSFVYYGCSLPADCNYHIKTGLKRGHSQSKTAYIREVLMSYFPKESTEPEFVYEWYNLSTKAYKRFINQGVIRFFDHYKGIAEDLSDTELPREPMSRTSDNISTNT